MTIPAIGALPSLPSLASLTTVKETPAPDAAQSFGNMVSNGLENLQQTQGTADGLAKQAATGDLTDLHDYMIASTQASLTTELTVAVRNRAVESFQEIMRMQV
jgi:flagellar hook-basal body complex protein FliE